MDNLYYKIAIIDRKNKNLFLKRIPKDRTISINSLICRENTPSTDFNFEHIYSNHIHSDADFVCLCNFEILFRPEYHFDLLSFLKEKSKSRKFAIIWPGEIQNEQLIYSRPGRPGYYTHKIDNYLIYKDAP